MSFEGVVNRAYQKDSETDGSNKNIHLSRVTYKAEHTGPYVIPIGTTLQYNTDVVEKSSEDTGEEREEWSNQCEFILSTVGYAVGLGNVWRFPYLAYKNGGGSFLVPYVIMLFIAGLPLFFMELVLGQYSRQGPTRVFGRIAPVFKGLGLAMLGATFFVGIYYNVIIAWTLFYMFKGMSSELPWASCTELSSKHCIANATNLNVTTLNDSYAVGPPEDFFLHQMLGLDKEVHSWDDVGELRWQMVLCLLGAWTIVCLCLIKGVQSSGKVVYFTALFPFVVLIILFIFSLSSLPGASAGIKFYVTPDFGRLKEIEVWTAAANQIFFSLGPTFGGLITLSSYNKFNNNCHRDALLVSFINCGTSVFAGFVIFSILGFMAEQSGQAIKDIVQSGPSLAFVAYPEAVTKMPIPPIWSFLFFFMLLTLGLDSMFTFVETITTAVIDQFSLKKKKHYVVIGTCLVGFVCGLSMCTSGGFYMFELLDATGAGWNIMVFALIELVVVSWLYGVNNFCENIKEMEIRIPKPVEYYWKACWCFITPITLGLLLIVQFWKHEPYKSNDYVYPPGIQALGWLISFSSVALIPGFGIYEVLARQKKGKKLGWALFQPTRRWGPPEFTRQKFQVNQWWTKGQNPWWAEINRRIKQCF